VKVHRKRSLIYRLWYTNAQLHEARRLIKSNQGPNRNIAPTHNDVRARHNTSSPIRDSIHTPNIFAQHTLNDRWVTDSYVVNSESLSRRYTR
jgi:hypothetical protein